MPPHFCGSRAPELFRPPLYPVACTVRDNSASLGLFNYPAPLATSQHAFVATRLAAARHPIRAAYRCPLSITGNTHTHTHTFNGPFSGTTQVSRYQKGKTNLDFTEARDSEWQWHQPGHMQVCTSLQADNHANTSPLSFFTGRMPFLPPNQQHQSTEGTNYRVPTTITIPAKAFARDYGITGIRLSVCLSVCYHDN